MTHLELLNRLPSPIREQAIVNATKYKGELWFNQNTKGYLHDVIMKLDWVNDLEYWSDIYQKAATGEFDDPSVTLPREDWGYVAEVIESCLVFQPEETKPKLVELLEAIQSQLNPKQ